MTALAFNQAEEWKGIAGSSGAPPVDLAFTLMLDTWRNQTSLAMRVSRIRATEQQERLI
jgi:hypothetical protein